MTQSFTLRSEFRKLLYTSRAIRTKVSHKINSLSTLIQGKSNIKLSSLNLKHSELRRLKEFLTHLMEVPKYDWHTSHFIYTIIHETNKY